MVFGQINKKKTLGNFAKIVPVIGMGLALNACATGKNLHIDIPINNQQKNIEAKEIVSNPFGQVSNKDIEEFINSGLARKGYFLENSLIKEVGEGENNIKKEYPLNLTKSISPELIKNAKQTNQYFKNKHPNTFARLDDKVLEATGITSLFNFTSSENKSRISVDVDKVINPNSYEYKITVDFNAPEPKYMVKTTNKRELADLLVGMASAGTGGAIIGAGPGAAAGELFFAGWKVTDYGIKGIKYLINPQEGIESALNLDVEGTDTNNIDPLANVRKDYATINRIEKLNNSKEKYVWIVPYKTKSGSDELGVIITEREYKKISKQGSKVTIYLTNKTGKYVDYALRNFLATTIGAGITKAYLNERNYDVRKKHHNRSSEGPSERPHKGKVGHIGGGEETTPGIYRK